MQTLNNRLFVSKYDKKEIKATVQNGIAMMAHKNSLCKLTVLVDAKLSDSSIISAGSTVYVKEETLFLKTAAGQNGGAPIPTYVNDKVSPEGFHILDLNQIEMVELASV